MPVLHVVSMQRLFDTVFIFFHNNNLWIEVWLVTICGKLEITMTKKKDPISPVAAHCRMSFELELKGSWVRFSHLELGIFFSFLLVLEISSFQIKTTGDG